MRIDITQKNYSMSEKLEEIIRKKAGKLSKYFDDDTSLKVVLKREGDIYKMEITATLGGTVVRSEIDGENMYDNIDILLPKIERQVTRHKTRLQKKLRKGAFTPGEDLLYPQPPAEKPYSNKVTRVKRFEVTPMTVESAADALDMIGHDFYIFQDEKSGKISVVYRRDDGTIGLLEPSLP